ncbi:hemerythrin domain-containing protein [Falsiroseomonas sp. HW251]|uniref:hemerythrin domain-containing protein n=1 Tax=Falsiroseomonas sp. HW251 TaxID=3390998 RepID=UPI003D31B242
MNLRTLMQAGPARANELFTKLAETSDGAVKTRERLFAELKAELELHASLEEQHLFPVLRRNAETKELVTDAIRDNRELRAQLAELEGLPKGDESFAQRLKELQKAFRQHARDEKTEILPAVQRALSEEQVQGVAEKIEAGRAEAEQAREQEAEDRRAQARQEREQADQAREQAEAEASRQREQEEAESRRQREELRAQHQAERQVRETARHVADAAVRPAKMATDMARQMTRVATTASEAAMPSRATAVSLTELFFAPWMGMMQGMQQQPQRQQLQQRQPSPQQPVRQAPANAEEVIALGEEVLEVGKRTEARGTARIHRFVVETPVERQVTLTSERVVVERRRPQRDARTGEVLTEVTVEVIETAEVPVVEKHLRLREEIVVRTERSERVETVRETLKRDEVEIEQPGAGRARRQMQRAH